MSGKRIYELTEKSNLENDYFMALDKSGTANAQKVNVSKILNPINNISGSADEYSSTKAYAVGDLVIHDNKLYKCTTACSAAAWSTNQGYFTQSTLTTELTNVKSSLTPQTISFTPNSGVAVENNYCYKFNGFAFISLRLKVYKASASTGEETLGYFGESIQQTALATNLSDRTADAVGSALRALNGLPAGNPLIFIVSGVGKISS